jgi:hypothetical protein
MPCLAWHAMPSPTPTAPTQTNKTKPSCTSRSASAMGPCARAGGRSAWANPQRSTQPTHSAIPSQPPRTLLSTTASCLHIRLPVQHGPPSPFLSPQRCPHQQGYHCLTLSTSNACPATPCRCQHSKACTRSQVRQVCYGPAPRPRPRCFRPRPYTTPRASQPPAGCGTPRARRTK